MMISPSRVLKPLVPPKWSRKVREWIVPSNVTHLHGPKRLRLSSSEAVVTCVLKNGEYYIEPFIRHYTKMGFRHIFFLDNGSTDQTISIARQHDNVSVCESKLAIEPYQPIFKKYLAEESCEGGWCLDADIDEFFDYPFSDVIGLNEFLDYLKTNQYTAVLTQLLDMFSGEPISDFIHKPEASLKEENYQYYDVSDITKTAYRTTELGIRFGRGNMLPSDDVALYFGGIRRPFYGDCLLSKHSLFMPNGNVELFPQVHFVNNARLADISCVMLHYKLTSSALSTASQNKVAYPGNEKLYGGLIDFFSNNPRYQFRRETSIKFERPSELVDNGFLFMSQQFSDYVRASMRIMS